ncbi:MAG: MBL fold metallo-hydrolase [Ruminococcaceae bacterium]|nr:MBL fold metallo-hydrolase [Oscillospiraceae bacterium]
MKITVLTENTACRDDVISEHGLSIYIETKKHKILFDSGQSDAFLKNAERLGVDISKVDIAVLSHGHYDHGGGLKAFLKANNIANVYVNKFAFGKHYNQNGKYIGLDCELLNSNRLIFTDDELKIDGELSLYSCNQCKREYKTDPFGLCVESKGIICPDDFLHEQYLLVKDEDKRILFSGCSHKGVLNIVKWFSPDVLVGGFHFSKIEVNNDGKERLSRYAQELLSYPIKYYTGHCTGDAQYAFLKGIMADRLEYICSGRVLEI